MYYFLNETQKKQLSSMGDFSKTSIDQIPDDLKDIYVLIMIRNKFAHNQLLPKDIFNYINKKYPLNESKIGDYFNEVFSKLLKEIKNN